MLLILQAMESMSKELSELKAYFSNQTKSRLQVLQSLCGLTELPVIFNEDTVLLLEHFKVPKHYQNALVAFWWTQESSSIGQLKA